MVDEKAVRKALRKVKDPELNLDVVVLGLIYEIAIQDDNVHVLMSLTSPMCPAVTQMTDDAQAAVSSLEGVKNAEIELTFEPQWSPERIDPLVRAALGI